MARWIIFIDQFERALNTGLELYTLGDVNLDFLTWTKADLDPNHRTVKLRPLINILFDKIISRGVKQCVTCYTQSWPGQEDTGLDQFYTNTPSKVSSVQTHIIGSSDHKMITAIRFANVVRNKARYCRKRSYKHFNEILFKSEVRQAQLS